ncbi:MAG: hypothetical protein AB1578_05280 [Thermodesulfobacteriota bacterium]
MKNVLRLVLVFGCLGLTLGCAATGITVSGGPAVPVDVVEGVGPRVTGVAAHREEQGLVVTGRVERLFPSPVRGHVDVAVLDAGGRPVAEASADPFPHHMQRGGKQSARFTARLAESVPDGGGVRVRYHAKGSAGSSEAGCGENAAARGA